MNDPFGSVLGDQRGSDRPDAPTDYRAGFGLRRRVLALVAAHGILDHSVAVDMPGEFSAERIASLLEHGDDPRAPWTENASDELQDALSELAGRGLLRCDHNRQGVAMYQVTPAGMVELWCPGSTPGG